MPKFNPTPADLEGWGQRLERSAKRWEPWRKEYRLYRDLKSNSITAWNAVAPGGNGLMSWMRDGGSTVVRNGVGQNVWTFTRRMVFKNPKFSATPQMSQMMVGETLVNGNWAAYSQAEVVTYGFRQIKFTDTLTMVVQDGKTANEGWVKLVSWDGADAAETEIWPGNPDGSEYGETSAAKLKPRVPCNSLATARFPGITYCDVEDVFTDPDAVLAQQINWIAHRVMKPLWQMRTQEIDDPDGAIDEATGQVKKVPKYKNLENLSGNLAVYQDMKDKGDPRNDSWQNTDYPASDYLVYYEVHCRFPANSKKVVDAYGGVPRTIDGFVYYMLDLVEVHGEEGKDSPTCIRWQEYPVDLGGFALKRWQPRIVSGSQKGFSNIRDYYEANALENYWWSYLTHYMSAVKPQKLADTSVIDPKDVGKLKDAGHWATLMCTPAGGKTVRDGITITEYTSPDMAVFSLAQNMRAIAEEASGTSPNQRGAYSGAEASATEASIVQANADEQLRYEEETLKAFVEDVAHAWIRLFRAQYTEGRFEIPGSEGGFAAFDAQALHLECVFQLDYSSMMRQDDPVKAKQVQEFMMQVAQTPPNLWPAFRPLWRFQATTFSPALLTAYREFEKVAFDKSMEWEPDAEHLMMREGVFIDPTKFANVEDFVATIPKHEKMLAQIISDPAFSKWNEPIEVQDQETGQVQVVVPRQLLSQHIALSKQIAMSKGLGPMLGLSGDQAGAARKQRGSGMAAGRMSQQATPNPGEMGAGAANVTEGVAV